MIIAVVNVTFAAAKRKPEKNLGLYGIRTLDLCDTGAALYQLFFFSGSLFAAAKVAYVTATIILHLILHSAVHIYDFHIIHNSIIFPSLNWIFTIVLYKLYCIPQMINLVWFFP